MNLTLHWSQAPMRWPKNSVPNFLEKHKDILARIQSNTQDAVQNSLDSKQGLKNPNHPVATGDIFGTSPHSDLAPFGKLIESGGINVRYRSNTALIMACFHGDITGVEFLLRHQSVLINATNGYGNTALILAAQENHISIVELLLSDPRLDILSHDQGKKILAKTKSKKIYQLIQEKITEKKKSQSFFARFFKS